MIIIANRVRKNEKKLFLSDEELATIKHKMQLMNTENFSAYARKMLVDGYIINVDYSDVKKLTYEINKIGQNINQITKRINETNSIYLEDIEEVKELLNQVWHIQKQYLLKQP